MINPYSITNFERSQAELEEFLLFCVCVAGKNAIIQAQKLNDFLALEEGDTPFQKIANMSKKLMIWPNLQKVKMGQYDRIGHAFCELRWFDVNNISIEDIESIPGIGPKTSRFFMVHSRPNQRYGVLDTHILRYMREQGIKTPKATPDKKQYSKYEKLFLDLVPEGMSVAEFDLELWKSGRDEVKKSKKVIPSVRIISENRKTTI